ncbi:MAG: hypothetical protein ACR2QM_20215, partial [Longimicrobiales bacterium]
CELTIFAVTGERKETKRYRVLFVDDQNAMWSKLAQVAAESAYEEAGRFTSAGVTPAEGFSEALMRFCKERGISLTEGDAPLSLAQAVDRSRHYHVIVGLGIDPAKVMDDVPFRSVVLVWDLAEDGLSKDSTAEDAYRALMHRIRELMATLGVRDNE